MHSRIGTCVSTKKPGPFFNLFTYDVQNPCTQGRQTANPNQNGIVFFPGSLPLYKNGVLVGGLYAVFAAGVRPGQSIDAMAVVYMVTTLVWLLIALRFVDPTQIVTRAKR